MLLLYLFTLRLVSLFLSSSILFSAMPNGGSDGKESACSARDSHSILRLGRSPGGGHGNPLQYSCLENSMDRGAWQATPLLCLQGVPDLPVAPQDEAGLTKTFQTWPRGWFHIP